MELWEFIKMLAEADLKTVLLAMINPVYGPMMIWIVLGCIVSDLEKLFGKH